MLFSGLRLFKEPSAKSNKLIIQNAIAHCCLAGKVNEAQKNAVLEVMHLSLTGVAHTLHKYPNCLSKAIKKAEHGAQPSGTTEKCSPNPNPHDATS